MRRLSWPTDAQRPGLGRPSTVVWIALRRFASATLVALVVLGLGSVALSRRIAHEEALRDARVAAAGIADGVVAAQLDAYLEKGPVDRPSMLEEALQRRLSNGSISHVKIWSPSGEVLWSDEEELIGKRYVLPERVLSLFGTHEAVAEPADAEKPVQGGEHDEGNDLLEVYVGSVDRDGHQFVFETYTSRDRLAHNTQIIFVKLLPIGLAALLLLGLATLPLALSLARRVDQAQRHRTELLRHSLAAWSHERRRLAQELHDTVVQDLSAAGYALPTVVDALPERDALSRETGEHIGDLLLRSVRSLRTVMGDLAPPDVAEAGLHLALADLVDATEAQGIRVSLDLPGDLVLERDIAQVVYRVVREGLRNVVKHARARNAVVGVHGEGERVEVRVSDDGQGGAAAARATTHRLPGHHLGLGLLADTLAEVGGELRVEDRPGGGTVLAVSLPRELAT